MAHQHAPQSRAPPGRNPLVPSPPHADASRSAASHTFFHHVALTLASAAVGALVALARGGKCRVFNSDQRIYIPATGLYTYADGGVACGRWELHADGLCLRNPVRRIEVLSPSTRDDDRDAKRDHRRRLASLRHVLRIDDPSAS